MKDIETPVPPGPVQADVDAKPRPGGASASRPTEQRAGLARSKAMERFQAARRGGGLYYTAAYAVRWVVGHALESIDRHLVSIEQKRCLVEPWTISSKRNTVDQNKLWWNRYDWSKHGEEWTKSEEWKRRIIEELLVPNVPEGGTIVEIGPGGGRWTEILRKRAAKLYVVDVSDRVIEVCRERFAGCANVEYRLNSGSEIEVPDASIDAIWSYDVFVHIDPVTVRGYFQEFQRVLKPGGRAVIHHAGQPVREYRERRRGGWRSDVTDKIVAAFARECGLDLIYQGDKLVQNEDDALTILEKPPAEARRRSSPGRAAAIL